MDDYWLLCIHEYLSSKYEQTVHILKYHSEYAMNSLSLGLSEEYEYSKISVFNRIHLNTAVFMSSSE